MKLTRRKLLAMSVAAPSLPLVPAYAQTGRFPGRPIKLIVPTPAGGLLDVMGRSLARRMGERLGGTVIVENKPGATTLIATEYVAKSAPDGYTLLLTVQSIIMNPLLYSDGRVKYDPFKDFQAISRVAANYNVYLAVRKELNVVDFPQFVQRARAAQPPLSYGTVGIGNPTHFFMEAMKKAAGIPLTMIPYKGDADVIRDLLAGVIDSAVLSAYTAAPYHQSGAIAMLACTGQKRSPVFPSVPTFAELGLKGVGADAFYGVFGPAGIPKGIALAISTALQGAVAEEAGFIRSAGLDPVGGTPEEFDAVMRQSHAEWSNIIKNSTIRLE